VPRFKDRLQHAWNALTSRDPTQYTGYYNERGSSYRPDRLRLSITNERSIIGAVYNRIGIDVASIPIKHVRLDENDRYIETMVTSLNDALTVSANTDQTGRSLIQDAVMSMCDEGVVAIVPVDTTGDPNLSNSYDILTLRVAKIVQWYPSKVKVRLYNEKTGFTEDIDLPKSLVAIVENPLYTVMNEFNSTLKRLISKLNTLDSIDDQSSSGKLDIIVQLPYIIKTEARRQEAEKRRHDLEEQLSGSKYGIGYIDGTEKVTQLNRPAENNLMAQIEYLTRMLYGQLGITEEVLNGTADEKTMLNYFHRTIKPMLNALVDEMKRKFLTKTARSQRQSIKYFRDPFALVPVSSLADIADKFTRNEVLSPNDMRGVIDFPPSSDPKADELRNRNLNEPVQNNALNSGLTQEPNQNKTS
jgi:hypothetical protein